MYNHKLFSRLQKMRLITALFKVMAVLLSGLLLLPLIILFMLVGLIGMTLLSRQYMKPHRAASASPFLSTTQSKESYQDHPHIERARQVNSYQTGKVTNQ